MDDKEQIRATRLRVLLAGLSLVGTGLAIMTRPVETTLLYRIAVIVSGVSFGVLLGTFVKLK